MCGPCTGLTSCGVLSGTVGAVPGNGAPGTMAARLETTCLSLLRQCAHYCRLPLSSLHRHDCVATHSGKHPVYL